MSGRGERVKATSKRILIVDDNADAANSLAQVLALDGHVAEPVYSASAALKRAASFAPEIVLLDLGLPEMDGYEVARRLRQRPEFAGVRIVALTGYGQSEDLRAFPGGRVRRPSDETGRLHRPGKGPGGGTVTAALNSCDSLLLI